MQTYYLFSIPECAVVLGARGVNYARQLGQEARQIVLKVEVFGYICNANLCCRSAVLHLDNILVMERMTLSMVPGL